jgi:predicted Zn finger-like uncharacterized protein
MTGMFTTCPVCRSNLAVTAADLRIGQGYVRCGRCDRVFNALITLSEELQQDELSGLAATGTTTMPALDYAGEDLPDDEVVVQEEREQPAPAATESRRPGDYNVDLVESQATGTFETIVLEGDGYLQTEEHVDEGAVEAQLQELTRQMDASAAEEAAAQEHPDQEIILETSDEAAEEEFDADAAVGNRRRHHWVWWLVASVLSLALAGQLLHHNRQALVAQPRLQQPVQWFYGLFGVEVEPQWDVKAYDVRQIGGDVLMGAGDTFTVQATIHNRATIAQPPPVIRAVLRDRYQNILSTIDITPAEYLLSAAPARMAPDQRFDTTLRLKDPTQQAAGFELDTCLLTAGGKLRCSSDR